MTERVLGLEIHTVLAVILSSAAEDAFSWDVLLRAERRRVGDPVEAVVDMASDLLRVSS
jgi:hypothetical protein